jgi:hypothetical protein
MGQFRNCTFILMDPLLPGGRLQISGVSGSTRELFAEVVSNPLSGRQISGRLSKGWEGQLTLSAVQIKEMENLRDHQAERYHASGFLEIGDLYQYIKGPDGDNVTYKFTGASLSFSELSKAIVGFQASARENV